MPNDCGNHVTFIGKPENVRRMITEWTVTDDHGSQSLDLTITDPMPDILKGLDPNDEDAKEKAIAETGHWYWRAWQDEHWGTKWGPYEVYVDQGFEEDGLMTVILRYNTAWGPLSDRFHNLISSKYGVAVMNVYDEPNMMFCGGSAHVDGETVGGVHKEYEDILEWLKEAIKAEADIDHDRMFTELNDWQDSLDDQLFRVVFHKLTR